MVHHPERRETDIRSISEAYGRTWCWNNNKEAKEEINAWLTHKTVGTLNVRVYSREENKMNQILFTDVVAQIASIEGGGTTRTYHPIPTRLGQVALAHHMYVSTSIFDLITLRLKECAAS
jgi:hypothetical protein